MKQRFDSPIISLKTNVDVEAQRLISVLGNLSTTEKPIGVTQFAAKAGDVASVQQAGIAVVIAGSSITAGTALTSDANGKAVALTISTANDLTKLAGYALEAANADDELTIKLS